MGGEILIGGCIVTVALALGWVVYSSIDNKDKDFTLTATVIEPGKKRITVNPDDDDDLLGKEDILIVLLSDDNKLTFKVGDRVRITYSGQVMLSYPPQIYAINIELIDKIRIK